jgi:predicted DNA-binding transcriptional regulator YafY
MRHLIAAVRRTIRAALHTAQALVTTVRGYRFGLLVDLYRAIDNGAQVVIGYRKPDGTDSTRTIELAELRVTDAGDITVRAHDHQSGEDRTFRIDRITHHALAA